LSIFETVHAGENKIVQPVSAFVFDISVKVDQGSLDCPFCGDRPTQMHGHFAGFAVNSAFFVLVM